MAHRNRWFTKLKNGDFPWRTVSHNQMVLGISRDNDHGNQWINVDYLRSAIFRETQKKESTFTWWLIPLSKWVITPVINGISRVNPLITGVITHLLSGMSHQVMLTAVDDAHNDSHHEGGG